LNSKLKTAFYVLPLGLAVIFVGILVSQKLKSKDLPILGHVPGFTLTDHTGSDVNESLFTNKIGVINFMFTTCQGICPTLSGEMKKLQTSFSRFDDFKLVSISVDPVNDTPKQLSAWTKNLNINTSNWSFLTGAREHIRTLLVDGLKVGLPDQPQAHTDRFVLVDRSGDIRGYYRLARPETLEQLRVDIFSLLRG